jgi:glyoxylase I family protein
MIVEFALDAPNAVETNATRRNQAHAELKKWLAGDHTSDNIYR